MNLFGSLVESWFIHSFSLLTAASFLPPGCNSRTQNFPLNSLCRLLSELVLQEGFCCLKISKLSRIKRRILNLHLSFSIHFGGCELPTSSPMRDKKENLWVSPCDCGNQKDLFAAALFPVGHKAESMSVTLWGQMSTSDVGNSDSNRKRKVKIVGI